MKANMGPRFFIDHGVIHDRVTSRHVAAGFEDDWQQRLLELLNEQENKILAAYTRLCERKNQGERNEQ